MAFCRSDFKLVMLPDIFIESDEEMVGAKPADSAAEAKNREVGNVPGRAPGKLMSTLSSCIIVGLMFD